MKNLLPLVLPIMFTAGTALSNPEQNFEDGDLMDVLKDGTHVYYDSEMDSVLSEEQSTAGPVEAEDEYSALRFNCKSSAITNNAVSNTAWTTIRSCRGVNTNYFLHKIRAKYTTAARPPYVRFCRVPDTNTSSKFCGSVSLIGATDTVVQIRTGYRAYHTYSVEAANSKKGLTNMRTNFYYYGE